MVTNVGKNGTFPGYSCFFIIDLFWFEEILKGNGEYQELLKTGLGILDFYHSDWLNGARLSAHIPAVTKYGQRTLNNKMNKASWKFSPRQQPGERNRQEKSLGSEFELSRNSNRVTNSVV